MAKIWSYISVVTSYLNLEGVKIVDGIIRDITMRYCNIVSKDEEIQRA